MEEDAEIIPANDARSIQGLEIVWTGTGIEIGKQPLLADEEEDEEEKGAFEDDEERLLKKDDLVPIRLNLRRSKIRWFLYLTGNFPKAYFRSKFRYVLYTTIQIIMQAILVTYMAFTFGWIKNPKEWPTLITADGDFVFTKVHDVIWELKWLLSYIFGLFYLRSGHLEWFFAQLRIPKFLWKKSKRHGFVYGLFVICMVIIAPTFIHAMKLHTQFARKKQAKVQNAKEYILCTVFYFMFRLITVPSFCAITAVLYFVKVLIDSLGRVLKNHANLGLPYAKREIRDVKEIIRKTDTYLKWYLLLHLVLILFTAFTGLFSLLEQFEFKISSVSSNRTSVEFVSNKITMLKVQDAETANYKREIAQIYEKMDFLRKNITEAKNKEVVGSNIVAAEPDFEGKLKELEQQLRLLTIRTLVSPQKNKLICMPAQNQTVFSQTKQSPSQLMIQFSKAKVLLMSLVELAEVTALFLVPLLLLAWHQRALLRIKDEIRDLDEEEQLRKYLLISNKSIKADILEELDHMRGVSIFGLQVSLYKAAFIAILAPFTTAVLHALFKQYQLY